MMDRGTVRNMYSYSKNIFEKFVHLVGFIIRIYHDAGHLNVKLINLKIIISYKHSISLHSHLWKRTQEWPKHVAGVICL